MKQLFKTTLLAASMAASFGSAYAGTLKVASTQVHSLEGLASVAATAQQDSTAITYTLGTGYLSGDKITFTLNADAFKGVVLDSDIKVARVDSDDIAVAKAGITMSQVSKTDNSVTYRVTNVEQPRMANGTAHTTVFNTTGVVVPLNDASKTGETLGVIKYLPSVLAGGASSLTITVSSQDATGSIIDNTGDLVETIAQSKSQFTVASPTITKFDGVIDVAQLRKAFIAGGVSTTVDAATFTATPVDSSAWLNTVTANKSTLTLQGEAGKMTGLTKADFASAKSGTVTLDEANATLTVAYSSMVTNDTITFTAPSGTKAQILEAQDFTGKLDWGYGTSGSATAFTGADFGEWKLNGATVNIPYMPYGPSSSQIIYVTNAGSQSADISVTVFDDKGEVYDLGVLDIKALGSRVVKVGSEINQKLRAAGFLGSKASITLTVNAPESDITVYASYNVGGADRGYVNTDQYKGK